MAPTIPVVLLPGAVLPARLAYGDLIAALAGASALDVRSRSQAEVTALGPQVDARAKELEVYAAEDLPGDYSLDTEVDGIARCADDAGFDRFHLVGYSAGGASSLAFCARHPERLLSLTLNEPAWAGDFDLSEPERARRAEVDRVMALPDGEMLPAFIRAQLRDGVEMPPPPEGPAPDWMRSRPKGLRALVKAFASHRLEPAALQGFARPVLFALGGRSHPGYYAEIAARLSKVFPDFTLEVFPERHHFDPPHRVEPGRLARVLLALWTRATEDQKR